MAKKSINYDMYKFSARLARKSDLSMRATKMGKPWEGKFVGVVECAISGHTFMQLINKLFETSEDAIAYAEKWCLRNYRQS